MTGMSKRRRHHLVSLLLAFVAACGEGDPHADDASGAEGARVPECQRLGYPCVWSQVAPEALAATVELASEGLDQLEAGEVPGAVAVWLASLEGVAGVMTDGELIRFWVRGGRPVWVALADEKWLGTRSVSAVRPPSAVGMSSQGTSKDDAIGDQEPGTKPWKKALILAPFQWEFGPKEVEDLKRRLGVAAAEDTDPSVARDYRCAGGDRCVTIKTTELAEINPEHECWEVPGSCPLAYGVERADFKSFKNYDLIHVATHGFHLCGTTDPTEVVQWAEGKKAVGDRDPAGTSTKLVSGACVVALATGHIYPDGSIPAGGVSDPGVEYFFAGRGQYCTGAPPNSIRHLQQYCAEEAVLLEVLTDDFFTAAYTSPLADKFIFLNACSGLAERGLAAAIAGPTTYVLGWTDVVPKGTAIKASEIFYEAYLGQGLKPAAAWYATASDSRLTDYESGLLWIEGGFRSVLSPELAQSLMGSAELEGSGAEEKRGVEIVFLLDPDTEEDLQDGAPLPLAQGSAPGDGNDDALVAFFEVIGVGADDDADDYVLHLRVGDEEVSDTFRPRRKEGSEDVLRHEGEIDLGFDLPDVASVDVEVWADLPGGGISRWLYEDLVIGGCRWSATLSGPAVGGTLSLSGTYVDVGYGEGWVGGVGLASDGQFRFTSSWVWPSMHEVREREVRADEVSIGLPSPGGIGTVVLEGPTPGPTILVLFANEGDTYTGARFGNDADIGPGSHLQNGTVTVTRHEPGVMIAGEFSALLRLDGQHLYGDAITGKLYPEVRAHLVTLSGSFVRHEDGSNYPCGFRE